MTEEGNTAPPVVFIDYIDLQGPSSGIFWLYNSVCVLDRRVTDNYMTGKKDVTELADILPLPVIFSEDINAIPCIYKACSDWRNRHGANLPIHSSHHIRGTFIWINMTSKGVSSVRLNYSWYF